MDSFKIIANIYTLYNRLGAGGNSGRGNITRTRNAHLESINIRD